MHLLMMERNKFKWTEKLAGGIIFPSYFLLRVESNVDKRINTNLPAGTLLSIDSFCVKLLFVALL